MSQEFSIVNINGFHHHPITPPSASTNCNSGPQLQLAKKKRGRPPKKTPIDTQTMTTTPYVSVASSTNMSQSAYSFQFNSQATPNMTQHHKKKSSSSISSSPPDHSSSRTPQQVLTMENTTTTNTNALGIDFGATTSSHVDPSLITMQMYSSSAFSGSATKSSPPSITTNNIHHQHANTNENNDTNNKNNMTPATPTFGSILSSSPMYPVYYDENVPPPSVGAAAPPSPKTVTPAPTPQKTNTNSGPLSSPFQGKSANASTRRAISERRNGTNLTLSRSQSMRRLSTAPSLYSPGPLSAPIKSTSMHRSHSLKRRVSLNISDGRAAVVEEEDPEEIDPPQLSRKRSIDGQSQNMSRTQTAPAYSTTMMQRRHTTIYDKSIDYINDNARRMSLESLFPELSPPTTCPPTLQPSSTASSSCSSSSTSSEDLEPMMMMLPDDSADEDESCKKDDARDALKRALDQRNSSTASLDFYPTIPSSPVHEFLPVIY